MAEKNKRIRTANEGNELWKAYKELGETKLNEFRGLLTCNDIPYTTFIGDTEKNLDRIPTGRMKVYQEFFKNIDFQSLLPDVKKPARVEKRETKDEGQKKTALEYGLSK